MSETLQKEDVEILASEDPGVGLPGELNFLGIEQWGLKPISSQSCPQD